MLDPGLSPEPSKTLYSELLLSGPYAARTQWADAPTALVETGWRYHTDEAVNAVLGRPIYGRSPDFTKNE